MVIRDGCVFLHGLQNTLTHIPLYLTPSLGNKNIPHAVLRSILTLLNLFPDRKRMKVGILVLSLQMEKLNVTSHLTYDAECH